MSVKDYAKTKHMDAWLRHPVLGDPSFDTFQRLGDTVHRSEAPYHWSVNGSLFRDHDGVWYYYAGLYTRGYGIELPSRFRIYRSADQGQHWEDLGWGFEDGFHFQGDDVPSDGCPDVVLHYDEKQKKYLLTYDTYTYDHRWPEEPDPYSLSTSGAALAWADSPAGPFTRLPNRLVTNSPDTACGRFKRCYATTVLPRSNDYIAFILMDSGRYYSWGLAVATAPAAEGPWSKPEIILSCDRPEYYPCPLEFYPSYTLDGTVYCPATSVAKNRNFQALFEAPLEQAHDPAAWHLSANGNLWHSRNHPDEYYGIWGQTYHGFLEPDTGRFVVMFPSRDARDCGTLSVATRPWDTPHSDGFTMTAHDGPSISPLLCSYRDFTLEADFSCQGTIDFAFAYRGILGPNDSTSDAVPSAQCLSDYCAVRIERERCTVVSLSPEGKETVLSQIPLSEKASSLRMVWNNGLLSAQINGISLCDALAIAEAKAISAPIALVLQAFSRIECAKFQVSGSCEPYTLSYNAVDALLGAGQWLPDMQQVAPQDVLQPDIWHRMDAGYVGEGKIAAKWNVIGSQFTLVLPRSPAFGTLGVWVDGQYQGSEDLQGEGQAFFTTSAFEMGCHAVRVAPLQGRIAIDKLLVTGMTE